MVGQRLKTEKKINYLISCIYKRLKTVIKVTYPRKTKLWDFAADKNVSFINT